MIAGDYHLTIRIFGDELQSWQFNIICSSDFNSSDVHYIGSLEYLETTNSWSHAQQECLTKFGTPLATIKTQQDVQTANEIVQDMILETQGQLQALNLYIGLIANYVFDAEWKWIDGNLWYNSICSTLKISKIRLM